MATDVTSMLWAALRGRNCTVTKRDFDWNFNFGEHLNIVAIGTWRIVTPAGVSLAGNDDGHQFGLPEPVNVEAEASKLLDGLSVQQIECDDCTDDLRISFGAGIRLDILTVSADYESWIATLSADGPAIIAGG